MTEGKRKVGIISCSGEELCEGGVARLASLRVLGLLRPEQTVTICLPLFLAGDGQERAFAQSYPTITVDGCSKLCAKRGTEAHSGPVSASLVVSELLPEGSRLSGALSYARLTEADRTAVELVAERIAREVDVLVGSSWSSGSPSQEEGTETTCACASALPVGEIEVGDTVVRVVGLPLIFEQLAANGLAADETCGPRLLEAVRIYHPIPAGEEGQYEAALAKAYRGRG